MSASSVRAPHAATRSRRMSAVPTVLAASVIGVVLFFAVLNGLTPHDPEKVSAGERLLAPTLQHPLGTDQLGRDVLSRMIAGARTSLLGPTVLAAGVTVISTVLALFAAHFGGRVDAVISRCIDVFYAVPALVVAIVVVGVTGGGYWLSIAVLMVFSLPLAVRNLRAAALERARLPFMEAAITLGEPAHRILFAHLLPTIMPFVVATFFLSFTYSVLDLSSLSFLGLGVPPGAPDWGRMVADNRASLFGNAWATAGPAIGIVLLAVATNLIGERMFSRYEEAGRDR
jgi:ABC-type dipeptide/oligopeptide/nickel transport system permease subunit